jgi:predicted permease
MDWLAQFLIDCRTRAIALRRRRLRDRVDEEMQFHLEMRIDRLVAAGLTPAAARARARREFGNLPMLREAAVDTWRYGSMERLIQDIRYALRMLRRAPGFTAVAVISLALGIGANAAIFSLIDRVMLRLLPVEDPSRLAIARSLVSYPRYEYLRTQTDRAFTGLLGVAAITRIGVDGSEDHGSFAEGRLVSANYFSVLGVQPLLGRLIGPDDNRVPGGHPVIVISHGFWQRHFNSDPGVLGKTVRLTPGTISSGLRTSGFEQISDADRGAPGGRFTVIGVAPRGFIGEVIGQYPDFWAPLMMQEHFVPGRHWIERKSAYWIHFLGRLKPGVDRAQAQAIITLVNQQAELDELGGAVTEAKRRDIAKDIVELQDGASGVDLFRRQFGAPLMVLMVMVAVVLLIACANLANLLLARASARGHEISIRLAMGAGRGRMVRQLLTESIVLALLGGVVAIAIAWWGGQTMFAMVAEGNSSARLDLAPDLRTLLFTGAVALLTAILFGLVPALRATRVDVTSALKGSGRSTTGSNGRIGRGLVVVQVALSVILLIGTGLFTRTLYNMKSTDLGYSPERVLIVRVDPIAAGYTGDAIGRVCQTLLQKMRALPGVRMATFSENGLFSGTESGTHIRIDGQVLPNEDDRLVRFDQVGAGYFTNVGIRLLAGRDFTDRDNASAPRVAVINENMARFYFGDRNPIGHVIEHAAGDPFTVTIIGVSADTHDHDVRAQDPPRRMYVSFLQPIDGLTAANYELRTRADPAALTAQVRAAVREVDAKMPVTSIKPLTTLIDESVLRERVIAKLSLLFGTLAVVLASVGLYGVLAYSVTRRTNEIGIRMAIGAFPRDIVWMVLRETFSLVAIGIALGVPIALALSRYIESLLYNLTPTDPLTLTAVLLLMIAIALLAAIAPSRRAAGIDPLRALRYE